MVSRDLRGLRARVELDPLTGAGSLVEVLQDRYTHGAGLGILDDVWECDGVCSAKRVGSQLLGSTPLFNLYGGAEWFQHFQWVYIAKRSRQTWIGVPVVFHVRVS